MSLDPTEWTPAAWLALLIAAAWIPALWYGAKAWAAWAHALARYPQGDRWRGFKKAWQGRR